MHQTTQLKNKFSAAAILIGLVFSAPFAFYPKNEVLGILAFLVTSFGLAISSSISHVNLKNAVIHAISIVAALMLFLFHDFDPLYAKFILAVVLSFQLTLVSWPTLRIVRDKLIYFGARGAVLAIFSFAAYFAFDMQPFYRTLLGDGRSIPFFGLTNINSGFDNPELLIFSRPAFLFDEPGQFAHFILLSLAIIGVASISARRRWRTETFLFSLAGVATFSLAFWMIAAAYLCTQLRRWWVWLAIVVLALSGFAFSDNVLVEATFSRLGSTEQSEDVQLLAGDNRSREVELAYEAFKENPIWGAGWMHAEQTIGHFAANPLGPLGYSGLMAVLLYLPFLARFLCCARASVNLNQLLIVFLVVVFFAQRPYFYFPIFILLAEILKRELVDQ